MKKRVAVALAALIGLWLGHRIYEIKTTPPKILTHYTAEQEAAALKVLLATPESDQEAMLKAAGAYIAISDARMPDQRPPYPQRIPIQLHSATRELLRSGNVFRYVRWVRHAVIPALDRRESAAPKSEAIDDDSITLSPDDLVEKLPM